MGIPTGKFKGKDRCEWFEGKFAVICHSDGSGPMGEVKGLGILGYDPMTKIYTYYSVDSTGMTMTTVPRGKVDGKTWTYNDQAEMGGMTIKSRFIMVETSATSYTFKWEIEGEDGWKTVMDGVARKG